MEGEICYDGVLTTLQGCIYKHNVDDADASGVNGALVDGYVTNIMSDQHSWSSQAIEEGVQRRFAQLHTIESDTQRSCCDNERDA